MTMSIPTSALPSGKSVNTDTAHKRIAVVGWLVWPLLILWVPIFFMWLGYRLVSCTSDVSLVVCDWAFLAPLIPGGLIVGCLAFAVLTLHQRGREATFDAQVERLSQVNLKRVALNVRWGYRGLRETHKKHVRRTMLFFAFTLSMFVGFWVYYFGLPALASMIVGIAIVVLAVMFNGWVASPLGDSTRATLNQVLHKELAALRPKLPLNIEPATFNSADPAQITANLRDIYALIATLGPKNITDSAPDPDPQPLSALCLSGGGIRSATFNLGVIQGLAKIGLLKKFDYLSSVSGGGYIASWLRTWIHRHSGQSPRAGAVASRESARVQQLLDAQARAIFGRYLGGCSHYCPQHHCQLAGSHTRDRRRHRHSSALSDDCARRDPLGVRVSEPLVVGARNRARRQSVGLCV